MSNSWKQYGGRQNLYNNSHITATTITCDELSILNAYQGSLDINGVLTVNNDVIITGNLDISQNIILQDLRLRGNCTIDGTLDAVGPIISESLLQFGKPSKGQIYTTNSGVSFNLGAASSLNITGGSSNLLNVVSTSSTVRNVLAQNSSNYGIAAGVNNTQSAVQFTANGGTTTDFQIAYMQNSHLLEIDGSGSTYIGTHLVVGDLSANVLNEQVVMYDSFTTGAASFCPSVYSHDLSFGQALSLVSTKKTGPAVTAFNIMNTQSKTGLHCAAGAFPQDTSRAFGTFSTDASFAYPSLQIVSGADSTFCKSTTGFNTFSPVTDTYVADFNGPIYLHHNEVTRTLTTTYAISNTGVAFTYGCTAMIGAAVQVNLGTPPVSGWVHPVTTSTDNGVTWKKVNCDLSIFGVTQYDQTYSAISVLPGYPHFIFVGGYGGSFFYSNDTGTTWYFISMVNLSDFFTHLYAVYNGATVRMYASMLSGSGVQYMMYWDFVYSDLVAGNTPSISSRIVVPDTNFQSIVQITGSATHIYVLGTTTGGTAYLAVRDVSLNSVSSNAFPLISTNPVMYYYASMLAIVGNNKVYYCTDITQFPLVFTLNEPTSSRFTWTGIFLYDTQRAILVGTDGVTGNGVVYYSDNGLQTISPVSDSILNSQGNKFQLLQYPLNQIFIPDLQHFIFVGTYSGSVNRAFECYLPDIFSLDSHLVLDVVGRVNVTGNMGATSMGATTMSATAMDTVDMIATGDVSFNNCNVTGNFLAAHLNIQDVTILDNFTVDNVFTTGGFVQVLENAAFYGNVSLGQNIICGGRVMTNGIDNAESLMQVGDSFFSGHSAFNADVSFNRNVEYTEYTNIKIDGSLTINGPLSIPNGVLPTFLGGVFYFDDYTAYNTTFTALPITQLNGIKVITYDNSINSPNGTYDLYVRLPQTSVVGSYIHLTFTTTDPTNFFVTVCDYDLNIINTMVVFNTLAGYSMRLVYSGLSTSGTQPKTSAWYSF